MIIEQESSPIFEYPTLVWLLLVVFILLYCSPRHFRKTKGKGVKNSIVQPDPVPSLNDLPTAQAIWQDINLAQFQHMLTALQSALKESGYQLMFHGQGVHMHPHREEQVADNLIRARELFWAPNQSPEEIENVVCTTRRSGYSKKMLHEMLGCCARQNWYLTSVLTEWVLRAYPLRQVEIRVRGGVSAPIADLLPCLEDMKKYVGENPSPLQGEDIYRRGVYPSAVQGAPDVEYEVRLREVNTPPGFFPDAAGCRLPPCAVKEKDSLRTTFKTQVTVFVQDTSGPRPEIRTGFYEYALNKIKDGEREGTDYDDDSGYTFLVNTMDVSLVPRDAHGNVKEITHDA